MKPISFWHRLLDLISPRLCVVCGHRLTVTEEVICARCNFHLPRTGFQHNAYENEMAKLFWGQIPIERATAFFYYEAHAETANKKKQKEVYRYNKRDAVEKRQRINEEKLTKDIWNEAMSESN